MKFIIWMLILIGWSVLQARRKAMRERERQQVAREPEPTVGQSYQRYPDTTPSGVPGELDAIMEYARSRVQTQPNVRSVDWAKLDGPTQDPEIVTEIVPEVETTEYESRTTDFRRGITDLRTFFVMREVLGPPRAKKRFHPRLKAQD